MESKRFHLHRLNLNIYTKELMENLWQNIIFYRQKKGNVQFWTLAVLKLLLSFWSLINKHGDLGTSSRIMDLFINLCINWQILV